MIRSPAFRADSIRVQSRSKAASKAEVRQLPSRTQINLNLGLGLGSEVKKILVFADDNPFLNLGIAAYLGIQCLGQADIKNMLTIEAAFSQILRKGRWQSVIDQEFHDVRRTT